MTNVPTSVAHMVFEQSSVAKTVLHIYAVERPVTPALGGYGDFGNRWPHAYSRLCNAPGGIAREDRLRLRVCPGYLNR